MQPFEFNSVLFNFHDIVLIMTAVQCLFFSALVCFTNTNHGKTTLLLAIFLVVYAFTPIYELMMWGAEFKFLARSNWPNLYFAAKLAYFLDGPLLFLFIKSLVFSNFSLRKRDLLHLLPFSIFVIFMATSLYSHPADYRQAMIDSESFLYGQGYISLEFINKLIRVGYTVACLLLINRYRNILLDTKSNLDKAHIQWLSWLILGFMMVNFAEVVLVGSKVINLFTPFSFMVFEILGLTANYAAFILIYLLTFTAIRYFLNFERVKDEDKENQSSEEANTKQNDELLNPELAAEVDATMKKTRAYLDPYITLDKLSEIMSIMPKDLSMLINRHFGINFYEFVNKYRIEEAKILLANPELQHMKIVDIYLEVGFNSKSVFYTFFKKFEGMTPTTYRNACYSQPPQDSHS